MSLIQIVCTNCGAQYRLPETFKSDHAKCKKCGATIDVTAQRDQPAAPAKPAAGVKANRQKPERKSNPGRTAKASSRASRSRSDRDDSDDSDAPKRGSKVGRSTQRSSRRSRDDDDGDEPGARHSRGRTRQSSNMPLLAGGIIGVLAVVLVVLLMMMGGDPPATENTADGAATGNGNAEPATDAAAPDAAATDADATDADAMSDQPVEPEPAVVKKPKPTHKKRSPKVFTDASEIFKPKDELQPVEWGDWISTEDREAIETALANVRDGGLGGTRGKKTLEKLGANSFPGIVNQLRELNYLDTDDTMFAYELNRLLSAMTVGAINAGFRSQDYGEDISLADADWNGKTVKAWQQFHAKYGDPEAFKKFVKARKKRHMGK